MGAKERKVVVAAYDGSIFIKKLRKIGGRLAAAEYTRKSLEAGANRARESDNPDGFWRYLHSSPKRTFACQRNRGMKTDIFVSYAWTSGSHRQWVHEAILLNGSIIRSRVTNICKRITTTVKLNFAVSRSLDLRWPAL